MKNTKLINILRTFSMDELKQFEKFVASPYHNRGKNCMPLLKELQKFYHNFDSEKLTYEEIYKKLYPGKKFNKQVMWNLSSALEKMLDDFLIIERLNKDELTRFYLLQFSLSAKPLAKYYGKTNDEIRKFCDTLKIGEDSRSGADFFRTRVMYEGFRGYYYDMIDKVNLSGEYLKNRSEYTVLSFIRNLAEEIYNLNANEKAFNYNPDLKLARKFSESINYKEIIHSAREHNFEYTWVIEFYYYKIMCLLDKDNEEYFTRWKTLFEQNHEQFTGLENYNTMASLTTYCKEKIDSGRDKYFQILFEINNFRLKHNMYLTASNVFRKIVFIQMIRTALALDNTGWVKKFIDDYSSELNTEYKEIMPALGMAFLNFRLKKYERVLQDLNKIEFIDVVDKIQVKTLIAQTYYELGETDSLLSQIDSAKHFFRNNKSVSEKNKTIYGSFFNFLTNLVSSKEKYNESEAAQLKNEITGTNELNDKKWLLEKLEELQNK